MIQTPYSLETILNNNQVGMNTEHYHDKPGIAQLFAVPAPLPPTTHKQHNAMPSLTQSCLVTTPISCLK